MEADEILSGKGNGHPLTYQVDVSQANANFLKQIQLQFVQAGKGKLFLDTVKLIFERLRSDPLEFGDPLYRLPALKLLFCHVARFPLAVVYAVHEEKPLVIICEIKVLS
jgi:hypothetical protein